VGGFRPGHELIAAAIDEEIHHLQHDLAEQRLSASGPDDTRHDGDPPADRQANHTRDINLLASAVGIFDDTAVDHLKPEQLNDLVEVAISESERFYPAFQYVVWAGKSPSDALTASILETVGEA